jgi:four helix bundle protein
MSGGRRQETGDRRQETEDRTQSAGGHVDRKPAEKFQDLVVWQKAHQLVLRVYRLTSAYTKAEIFGLVSQMRRSAVSVPANIAEGFKRKGRSDKARVMNIAQGSLEELRYYFILSRDLEYLTSFERSDDVDEVGRMLAAYIGTLQR